FGLRYGIAGVTQRKLNVQHYPVALCGDALYSQYLIHAAESSGLICAYIYYGLLRDLIIAQVTVGRAHYGLFLRNGAVLPLKELNHRVNKISGKMLLDLKRRHRDNVLAVLHAHFVGDLHFLRCGHVLYANGFLNWSDS